MVGKIWVGMFTTNIFITPIQNSKSLAKTRTLNAGLSELIPKKNRLKFLTLHSLVCLFSYKYFNLIAVRSTLKSTSFDETIRCAWKWSILTQRTQNLQFVNRKCVTFEQPIPLPLTYGILTNRKLLIRRDMDLSSESQCLLCLVPELHWWNRTDKQGEGPVQIIHKN